MYSQQTLLNGLNAGNFKVLARALTLVENGIGQVNGLLESLEFRLDVKVIGITGPPGAGKSTLVSAVANEMLSRGKKLAILAVDPTSPFNFGALLGDRIRMASHFNHPDVFIRSIATRGALGGVSVKTLELLDVLRASIFDVILVETVGVGQSEIEIAGLADQTAVVLVPESGDEIQNIKSGLMEIAQAFVVNKADREGASTFANNLKKLITEQHQEIPIFKTIADRQEGIAALCDWMLEKETHDKFRKNFLIADKAYRMIQQARMADVDLDQLRSEIDQELLKSDFNLYRFIERWTKRS